jgi:hypothetical protein
MNNVARLELLSSEALEHARALRLNLESIHAELHPEPELRAVTIQAFLSCVETYCLVAALHAALERARLHLARSQIHLDACDRALSLPPGGES